MPELPEVETTRRGIEPHVSGRTIGRLAVHDRRLRWPVARALPAWAQGQQIHEVQRRAKYLLLRLDRGWLMLHLGMSGSLRVLPVRTALETHDNFDLEMDSGWTLRFNDPRRFGSLFHLDGRSGPAQAAQGPGAGAAGTGFQRGVSLPGDTQAPRGDQAGDHEQPPGRWRRQYLCERVAVPRRHPAGPRCRFADPGRMRGAGEIDPRGPADGDPAWRHDTSRLRRGGRSTGVLPAKALGV